MALTQTSEEPRGVEQRQRLRVVRGDVRDVAGQAAGGAEQQRPLERRVRPIAVPCRGQSPAQPSPVVLGSFTQQQTSNRRQKTQAVPILATYILKSDPEATDEESRSNRTKREGQPAMLS